MGVIDITIILTIMIKTLTCAPFSSGANRPIICLSSLEVTECEPMASRMRIKDSAESKLTFRMVFQKKKRKFASPATSLNDSVHH